MKTADWITAKNQINKVSEEEVLEAMKKVQEKNDAFRRSLKTDIVSLSKQVTI